MIIDKQKCSRCNIIKPASAYYIRPDNGKLRGVCKQCKSEQQKLRYHGGRKKRIQEDTKNKRLRRVRHLARYKIMKGCAHCGYNKHHIALEFHHKDPNSKEGTVSAMVTANLRRLISEVRKCMVLCSNCHAIHHYDERLSLEGVKHGR